MIHREEYRMKGIIPKNIGIGAMTGMVMSIAYAVIATIFMTVWAVSFQDTSITSVSRVLPTYILYFSIFLILPATIICTLTSTALILFLLNNFDLKETSFITICALACFTIASILLIITRGLIYNVDQETTNVLNLMFRTAPSILFVVWGYFFSRHIHRNIKRSSDG